MLTNISWASYLIAVGTFLLIWYLVLILKFYYKDFKKIFSGEKKFKNHWFKNPEDKRSERTSISSLSDSKDTLADVEELSGRIVQAISESAQKELSKEQSQNYLRMVLEQYPYVRYSSHKQNINKLIVLECEKYPQLYLTLSEADSLWEGAVF